MAAFKLERNRRLRSRRLQQASLRVIAREFGISAPRVVQILDETGGDPLRLVRIEHESEHELERRRARLVERIGGDLRALFAIDDELEVRRTDRILGI